MDSLPWKIRIAVLWAIGPIIESGHLILTIDTDDKWCARLGILTIHATFFYIVPLLMSLLTLILKDKVNRWVNIIAGILFGVVFSIIWFLEGGLGVIMYDGPSIGIEHALLLGFKVVVALFIPWFAWKWPKQEA